ncbi:TetR/AcrR family transcriptional regulator [Aquidulcibacter sp.]|uniref:TetR/AcrR family transcriptional regulator n=1 Tax=Aquidulcibacter sp. TaxID=2052990 RepID=UPI0025C72558|nr:TetR/AcrR family transcriptional regulator [Aquidulcibacter sp.]MCA3694187.1 TetR/AcrR family transcriptional regulator [Aquidulcibacter sp.]
MAATTVTIHQQALMVAQEHGVHAVTIESLAKITGIAKTTIYRRWPSAATIVMDAFLEEVGSAISYEYTGDIVATFKASTQAFVNRLSELDGDLLRQLVGEAQRSPVLLHAFMTRWINPRRAMGFEVIAKAIEAGELRVGLDSDAILDAIYGAIYYALLIPVQQSISSDRINFIIEAMFSSHLAAKVDVVSGAPS